MAAFLTIKLWFLSARGHLWCWKGKVIDIPLGKPLQKSGPCLLWVNVSGTIQAGKMIIHASKQTAQPKAARAEVQPCVSDGCDLADPPVLSYKQWCWGITIQKEKANRALLNGTERSHQQTQDPAGEAQEVLSVLLSLGAGGDVLVWLMAAPGCPKRLQRSPSVAHRDTELIKCRLPWACQDFQSNDRENSCGIPHPATLRGEPVCSPARMP